MNLTDTFEKGGLRMVDIKTYDSTENYIVKETFIETNKISRPSFEYVSFLSNFTQFGSNYIKNNLHRESNSFWKKVCPSLINFIENIPIPVTDASFT